MTLSRYSGRGQGEGSAAASITAPYRESIPRAAVGQVRDEREVRPLRMMVPEIRQELQRVEKRPPRVIHLIQRRAQRFDLILEVLVIGAELLRPTVQVRALVQHVAQEP